MKETERIEWKESWRDEYLKWICGFAKGGVLHIGRNNVANTFFRAGQIEAWGRGIQRIFDACHEAGAPEPRIEYEPGDLWIEFLFPPEYLAVIPATSGERKMSGKIVQLMLAKPDITTPELAQQLNRTERTIERLINQLKTAEIVRRIGPAKGGHWEVMP